MHATPPALRMVAFDGDDTLWRSQDFFDEAQVAFEALLAPYLDLADARLHDRLYAVEKRNLAVFGYGVKGMALSMIEAAVEMTDGRITGHDVQRIVRLAHELLRHPVELLPGVREAVERIAERHPVALVTKGDLFHQEAKVRESGLARLFRRIEIVSEKDVPTYARLLEEFGVPPARFAMVGNSLRSDVAPVLALGGWAVHVPYALTWVHEREADLADRTRLREAADAHALPGAIDAIERALSSSGTVAE